MIKAGAGIHQWDMYTDLHVQMMYVSYERHLGYYFIFWFLTDILDPIYRGCRLHDHHPHRQGFYSIAVRTDLSTESILE